MKTLLERVGGEGEMAQFGGVTEDAGGVTGDAGGVIGDLKIFPRSFKYLLYTTCCVLLPPVLPS